MVRLTGWFGFWMFMSVYIICETVMYLNGHETFFWKHKTQFEIQTQQKILEGKQ